MGNKGMGIAFALAIVATVITLDLLFFRYQPFHRLVANVSIVGFYTALYFILLKRS
jgi:hypothetical protein